jgi:hypothetical protein
MRNMSLLIIIMCVSVTTVAVGQKVSRAQTEKVAEIYRKATIPFLKKAETYGTDDQKLKSAISRAFMLKYQLIEYMDELSGYNFDDISILQLQLNKWMKKEFSLEVLPNEYYEEIERRLKEAFSDL